MKTTKIAATDVLPPLGSLIFGGWSQGSCEEGVKSTRELWQEKRVIK